MSYENPEFGVFYQVFEKTNAFKFAIENFRNSFPYNPLVLISDGGDDFSDYAEEYNCKFFMRENIYGNEDNKYPPLYNAYRTLEWWKRQKLVCDETKMDYIMIMEDDVWVRDYFHIDPPFALRGVRYGGLLKQNMRDDIKKSCGMDSGRYGMCGGSIYNAKIFLEIYDDVVNDIKENHDRLQAEDSSGWDMLGAVDASITYHYNKRGYKYEAAPWLAEAMRGEDIQKYPVIHQWKEHY